MSDNPKNLFSNKHKNSMKSSFDRKGVLDRQDILFESRKRDEENAKARFENYGSGIYTKKGTVDRLTAVPFTMPDGLIYEGDKISYHYGYYDRGTRLIAILINEGKINTGGIQISQEEFSFMLKNIAINDGMNPEIDYASLPEVVRNNDIYASGYMEGRLMSPARKSR